jgi:hypothetical protein
MSQGRETIGSVIRKRPTNSPGGEVKAMARAQASVD